MTYDWLAALTTVGSVVLVTMLLRRLAFRIPQLEQTRVDNKTADRPKMARKRYRDWVKVNSKWGLGTNAVFYLVALPFLVSFDSRPVWEHALHLVAILAVYDCMYYFTHRFIFHGRLLRKVHALHHQARTPTYIDSMFVHPLETVIGLTLFLGSIPMVSWLAGGPLHAAPVAIAILLFTQLNTLNHAWTNLGRDNWMFRTIDYITGVHASHHIDMTHGNYATLTMFFDWLFGTYEKPTHREAA